MQFEELVTFPACAVIALSDEQNKSVLCLIETKEQAKLVLGACDARDNLDPVVEALEKSQLRKKATQKVQVIEPGEVDAILELVKVAHAEFLEIRFSPAALPVATFSHFEARRATSFNYVVTGWRNELGEHFFAVCFSSEQLRGVIKNAGFVQEAEKREVTRKLKRLELPVRSKKVRILVQGEIAGYLNFSALVSQAKLRATFATTAAKVASPESLFNIAMNI